MDLEGLEVFASDSRLIGKVTKADIANGRISTVVVESKGYAGFFIDSYVIPGSVLTKKGNRVELTSSSETAKSLKR